MLSRKRGATRTSRQLINNGKKRGKIAVGRGKILVESPERHLQISQEYLERVSGLEYERTSMRKDTYMCSALLFIFSFFFFFFSTYRPNNVWFVIDDTSFAPKESKASACQR